MKKTVSLLLAFVLCLSLCACASNDSYSTEPNESSQVTVDMTEASTDNTENATECTDGTAESTEDPADELTTTPSEEPTEIPTEEETTPPTTVPEETESEEERMQKLIDYNKALDLLESVEKFKTFEQMDSMNKAYQLLINLGDYKDVQEIISRFTEYTLRVISHDGGGDDGWKYICQLNGDVWAQSQSSVKYCTNTYDDKGRLVRVDYTSANIGTDKANYRVLEYNEDGQLIRQEYVEGAYSTCWIDEYDATGHLVTRYESFRFDDGRFSETIYSYSYAFDEMGRIIKERKDYNNKYMELTYTYDEKGRVIEKASYASSNGSLYTYTYAYDENGNVIRESLVREIGGETSYDETSYTYSTVYIYTPPQG